MNKEQFLLKYDVTSMTIYTYRNMFPSCVKNGKIDFKTLDDEMQKMQELKEYAQELICEKKAKDLEFLFEGKHIASKAHAFLNRFFMIPERNTVHPVTYEKIFKIIEKFGKEKQYVS